MVVPLLRTVHSGAIWMQGEANAHADGRQYQCSFPAMISDWRTKFHKYTDGTTSSEFPFGWAQLNSVGQPKVYRPTLFDTTCGGTGCAGEFDEWRPGFPSIRLAESSTRSLQNTFQAVILDTPVASGSVHSPYKQAPGQRLARGALALAYGMSDVHAVDPVATKAQLSADGHSIIVSIQGIGAGGLLAQSSGGFEVLGNCSAAPTILPCATCLCWIPRNISSFSSATVTIGDVPPMSTAIRYLWYDSPCGNNPYQCPVYAKVGPLGTLSGEDKQLPLGPFLLKL